MTDSKSNLRSNDEIGLLFLYNIWKKNNSSSVLNLSNNSFNIFMMSRPK